jgi:lysozyme
MENIIKRIKVFEGFREKPYKCTAGKWTIGFGYNFEDRGFPTEIFTEILDKGFSENLAEELLKNDVERCISFASENFVFYNDLNEPRQAVVADMLYQLGFEGFKGFSRMLKALDNGDYARAAAEMVHSRWFAQSGRRSIINVAQMKTGIWQEVE